MVETSSKYLKYSNLIYYERVDVAIVCVIGIKTLYTHTLAKQFYFLNNLITNTIISIRELKKTTKKFRKISLEKKVDVFL